MDVRLHGPKDYESLFLAGFYPYYDRELKRFYWMREPTSRSIIKLCSVDIEDRVKRLRKGTPDHLHIHESQNPREVVEFLANERVKPETWVVGQVKAVYESRLDSRLHTIEARTESGRLVGAVLGMDFQGVYLGETMGSAPEPEHRAASRLCLCELVLRLRDRGYSMLDVQVRHPRGSPSSKLGEETLDLHDYLELVRRSVFSL